MEARNQVPASVLPRGGRGALRGDDRHDLGVEIDVDAAFEGNGRHLGGGFQCVGNPVGRRQFRILVAANAPLGLVVPGPDPATASEGEASVIEDLKLDRRAGRDRQVKRSVGLDGNLGDYPPGRKPRETGSWRRLAATRRPGRNSLDHAQGFHRTEREPRVVLELGLVHAQAIELGQRVVGQDHAGTAIRPGPGSDGSSLDLVKDRIVDHQLARPVAGSSR